MPWQGTQLPPFATTARRNSRPSALPLVVTLPLTTSPLAVVATPTLATVPLATPLLAFYSLYWTSHYDASSASSVPSSSTDTDAAAADDNSSSFFFFLSFSWWWSSLWMPLFRLLWRLLQHALYLGVGAMAWKCFVPVLGLAVTSDARKINFTDVTIHALALAGYFALEAAARVVAGVLSTASTTVLEPALASSDDSINLPFERGVRLPPAPRLPVVKMKV